MTGGLLEPALKSIAKRLRPHTRKIACVAGFSGGGALALPMVTVGALWLLAHALNPVLGELAAPLAHLLVYGPPLTLGALGSFLQTIPAVAAVMPPALGAGIGAATGWRLEKRPRRPTPNRNALRRARARDVMRALVAAPLQ